MKTREQIANELTQTRAAKQTGHFDGERGRSTIELIARIHALEWVLSDELTSGSKKRICEWIMDNAKDIDVDGTPEQIMRYLKEICGP